MRLGLAIALATQAGMRMGEVRAIEVRDVDFEGQRLIVRRALSEDISLTTKSGRERVRGASLEAVRLLAGHTKLETTQRYAHATGSDLRTCVRPSTACQRGSWVTGGPRNRRPSRSPYFSRPIRRIGRGGGI
jgi:site-specific recombinase XerD